MKTQQVQTESRRLKICRILADDADYSANDTLIQQILALQGDGVSLDAVRTDLAWLEEQQLLNVRKLPGCHVAILRSRGIDVSKGLSSVPGIARPRPE